MPSKRLYYYDKQFKKYLTQFLAVFGDMHVSVGKNSKHDERLIRVPIFSASKDRVVASIKGENTQNKALRLPAMSGHINAIDLAPETRKGVGGVRRQTVASSNMPLPEGMHVVEQRMPVPYKVNFELRIWASNQDQHYQILEQILMVFDPILTIQLTDEALDWKQITQMELVGVRPEENVPYGTDRRLIQTSLDFSIIVHIGVSDKIHRRFVESIHRRIGAVNLGSTGHQIISDLDTIGEEYEVVIDTKNIDFEND